ncbi:MAG: glutamine--fructose-6-phosphate transaminase (isomerizing) [bacterium]|nr:glutamine--fructose-6-phosphate transaminase (isomerizing) [bacterium]
MCGIVGYIGNRQAIPVILDGLKRLEYRGYDSAGIVVFNEDNCQIVKNKGRVADLEKLVDADFDGTLGIGHTRWATHGKPSDKNSHPHYSCDKKIFVVHNGIIENYKTLKEKLERLGHCFSSDTDTEVVAHLIEDILKSSKGKITFEEAVRLALKAIQGSYAFAIVNLDEPDKLVVARNSSPLLIGIGDTSSEHNHEYFVASDASALISYTRGIVYLNDGEYGILTKNGYRIADLNRKPVQKEKQFIEWTLEEASKQGHPHFMLKEIFEEPEAVENSSRGRLILAEGKAKLGGLESVSNELKKINRLMITACGTAYYAGLIGKYLMEEYAGLPTEIENASEMRYRHPVFLPGLALLSISQSGETADTLAAIREAKKKGLLTLGITNVVGSTIAREVDAGVYNHVGPEIGVASTKAFISQLTVLSLLTLYFGRERGMTQAVGKKISRELALMPAKMRRVFNAKEKIKEIARKYAKYDNFLYLARKYNFPIALEGALKLKEISYVHAEGYAAGEMKHGPIAMIDENFPSVFIALADSVYEKMLNNMEEVKARGGKIIAIATEGDQMVKKLADDVIYIPETFEPLSPLLSIIPLQLFAYYMAVLRGCDVDKPRNLAKSVTVE